jgi:hypothetical protein
MKLGKLKEAIEHELHMYKYGPDFMGGNTKAEYHVERIIGYIFEEENK